MAYIGHEGVGRPPRREPANADAGQGAAPAHRCLSWYTLWGRARRRVQTPQRPVSGPTPAEWSRPGTAGVGANPAHLGTGRGSQPAAGADVLPAWVGFFIQAVPELAAGELTASPPRRRP